MAVTIPLKKKYKAIKSGGGGSTKARTGSSSNLKKSRATAGNGVRRKAYGPF